MPDSEYEGLERELRELAPRVRFPPTPDVSRTVRRRLDAEPTRRRAPGAFAKPAWIAAAAAAVILLSLAALSPALRSGFSGFASSGAGGGAGQAGGAGAGATDAASAQYAAETTARPDDSGASGAASEAPAEAAGASAATPGGPSPGAGLGLGERISSSEARARTRLLLPEAPELMGATAVFHARGPSEADGITVVYRAGRGLPPLGDTPVGLILAEVPGDLRSAYPLAEGASAPPIEEVDVDGNRGYWLPDGRLVRPQPGDELPGGALLWEQEGTALLMRADVSKEEAVRIAGTVRQAHP